MAGYKGKYLRTYLWSGLAMLLNFVSMFIVAPLTTSMPEAYGVYSLCISFNIFLRYADLGFINAGRKYAAEAFANKEKEKEIKYVGNSMLIYSIMTVVFFLLGLVFSIFPGLIIKGIIESPYIGISHQLLLILSFSFLFSTLHKFCSLVYSVRIEEYKIQSIQIIGSAIKIISVPLYFFNNKYEIVGYYLFCELVNLMTYLFILYQSKKIGYGFKTFFSCLRFDKEVFNEIKPLALSGFASVVGWIVYYELDTIGISILLGASAVAVYAVAKQIQNFVRSFISIVFTPYRVRINYFIGLHDYLGLKSFYYKLSEEFCFVIIPIITIVFFARPFILSWVGNSYEESCLLLQLLVLTFVVNHVTSQGSSVIYGLNKVKDILKIAFIQPVLFWIGILITYKYWGVKSFAIFQLTACMVTELYYCFLTKKYLKYSNKEFYLNLILKPLVLICFSCFGFWIFTHGFLDNVSKGHNDLFFIVFIMGLCCIFSMIILLCFNKSLRDEMNGLIKIVTKK